MIDRSRWFMPEHLTPLFHTPAYAELTAEQQRHYNQLHACYLHEQTIFFESEMARPILRCFRARGLPDKLAAGVAEFMAEEARHSAMFRRLNRQCRPEWYAGGDFHFIRLSRAMSGALHGWLRHAGRFPLFLWLLLVQEERALFYAQAFLHEADKLEPALVAAQRQHLADEAGHLHWDEQLLDFIWPRVSSTWRRINARIFAWLVREFFSTPERSGWNVVRELARDYPGLRSRLPHWRAGLRALGAHGEFNRLAYSRDVTPRTFARFDRWPEFHGLARVLPLYRPALAPAVGAAYTAGSSPAR